MRLISFEALIQALRERSLDDVYLALERLFMEEPIVFINSNGDVVFTPYEPLELWDYLEKLYETL